MILTSPPDNFERHFNPPAGIRLGQRTTVIMSNPGLCFVTKNIHLYFYSYKLISNSGINIVDRYSGFVLPSDYTVKQTSVTCFFKLFFFSS